ncbi:hypothetical protein H696_03948 [Fonticula alba]|uniref:protein-tyrosine-phosphatase n=1 Tax=Fonticula alba TaxID=691883 RepID=A0A058Z7Q0_FONAL|nr:hypothetical protein H696_03948 [Fonticula alba]KCV69527.1 hypothetical protein H696_03948 [Fonticula alba]|eukprot:XP_009496092.1 hypothetical protein H696_03948 [Fonticula alba]
MSQHFIPPVNFGHVDEGIYRSGLATEANFPFLATLNLRAVIYLSSDEPPLSFRTFLSDRQIQFLPLCNESHPWSSSLPHRPGPELAGAGNPGLMLPGQVPRRPGGIPGDLGAGASSMPVAGPTGTASPPMASTTGTDDMEPPLADHPPAHPPGTPAQPPPAAIPATGPTSVDIGPDSFLRLSLQNDHLRQRAPSTSNSDPPPEEVVVQALAFLLRPESRPVLLMCQPGRHRTGAVVACLRKVQRWNLTSILEEYRRYAGARVRPLHEQFIELFDTDLISAPAPALGLLEGTTSHGGGSPPASASSPPTLGK